jgi:hypothetical protein
MKIVISKTRSRNGILLTECLVYLVVFAILTSIGFASFYLCWDQSRALIYATDDISKALRAGERWRADVRAATGNISSEVTEGGELLRIPHGKEQVFYSYHNGGVWRKNSAVGVSEPVFAKTESSKMVADSRAGVTAWRWELVLPERRPEAQLPLLFTFEAAQKP